MRSSASPLAVWAGILRPVRRLGLHLPRHEAGDRHRPAVRDGLPAVRARRPAARGRGRAPPPARDRAPVARRGPRRGHRRARCCSSAATGLVAWGEQTIPTGIAALLIGLVPMWLADLRARPLRRPCAGARRRRASPSASWASRSSPGRRGGVGELDPAGLLALIVSPLFWSLGTLYATKRAVLPAPALFSTGIQMIAGGVRVPRGRALLTGETAGFELATSRRRAGSGSPTSSSSGASSASRPTPGCSRSRRSAGSRRTRTSTRSSPSSSAGWSWASRSRRGRSWPRWSSSRRSRSSSRREAGPPGSRAGAVERAPGRAALGARPAPVAPGVVVRGTVTRARRLRPPCPGTRPIRHRAATRDRCAVVALRLLLRHGARAPLAVTSGRAS